jgi:arylsulfatase A-like enzyme
MKKVMYLTGSTILILSMTFNMCNQRVEAKRPNILFCLADDASYPHFGAYGTDWIKTPAIDDIAANGIIFTNAYTPNAKCAPSRANILTGRNSWQLEAAANHWCNFPDKFKTYAEVLTENGYHVGYTAKGWAPGKVGSVNGKKRQLTGQPYNSKKLTPPARYISENDYAANFKDFLKDRKEDQPFCFWYGSREPHRRYEYGAGVNKTDKRVENIDRVYTFWPDNEVVRTDMLDYAYEIEYFDQHLEKMLQLLEETGELDNTIVVVTADNGMPFPRIKGQEYEYSNHMPLAIMWKKGITHPGRIINDYISFIDFAPTFLEVAGIDPASSGMQPIEGKELTDIFYSNKSGLVNPARNYVLIGKERHDVGRPNDAGYPMRGIVKKGFLYLKNYEPDRWPAGNPVTGYLNCDGSPTKTEILMMNRKEQNKSFWQLSFGRRPAEELYNIKEDPDCMINLATNEKFNQIKSQLKGQMEEMLRRQEDPRMFGNGHVFDAYPYADESSKNFYERYMRGEKINSSWVNPTDFENN